MTACLSGYALLSVRLLTGKTLSRAIVSQVHNIIALSRTRSVLKPNISLRTRTVSSTLASSFHQEGIMQVDRRDSMEGDARQIFQAAVESVMPRPMLEREVKYKKETKTLCVGSKEYQLQQNVFVVGFGKAVSGMARVMEDMLGDHIVRGIISIPAGATEQLQKLNKNDMLLEASSKITVYEGAKHNLPDDDSLKAATEIHKLVSDLGEDDILIVLVSGGGSALLPTPCPPISLGEEMELTRLLAGKGATIQELNLIRSNIEVLKGGGLALEARPASVISLILSDVIGDPLDFIASGPTFFSATDASQCMHLFTKFGITDLVPKSVLEFLEQQKKIKNVSITVDSPDFEHLNRVQNQIVGNNTIATSTACSTARNLGYLPLVLSTCLSGDTRGTAAMFGKLAKYILLIFRRNSKEYNPVLATLEVDLVRTGISKDKLNEVVAVVEKGKNMQKGVCIVAGGETTTLVKGSGLGGRNQEMALAIAPHLAALKGDSVFKTYSQICFLSAGTDGLDGPTDAAGAVVEMDFTQILADEGISLDEFLENNDSYNLFRLARNGSSHIKIGHTGTNVMDIQILMVKQ
ncbi:glycerate kinase-like isoform X1 [Haliotis asinina]|uniref:glycerate kinase-like isoform X1 n=2 Tax=Haliotis asinina TaxID=109174 RepID=UPI0035320154